MPVREVTAARAEDVEPLAETIEQIGRSEHVEARRRQLDCQGQTVEPKADLGDDRGIVAGDGEPRPHRLGPFDEQLDGLSLRNRPRRVVGIGERKWGYGKYVLGPDPEGLPAGHDDLQLWCVLEEFAETGRSHGHLLEVVQHEQHLKVSEAGLEYLERVAPSRHGEIEGTHDRFEGGTGIALRGEIHEKDTTPKPVELLGGRLQTETGLPGTAGTGDRQQPDTGGLQHDLDRGELAGPSQELRGLERQIVRSGVEGVGWRELGRHLLVNQLEEMLGKG